VATGAEIGASAAFDASRIASGDSDVTVTDVVLNAVLAKLGSFGAGSTTTNRALRADTKRVVDKAVAAEPNIPANLNVKLGDTKVKVPSTSQTYSERVNMFKSGDLGYDMPYTDKFLAGKADLDLNKMFDEMYPDGFYDKAEKALHKLDFKNQLILDVPRTIFATAKTTEELTSLVKNNSKLLKDLGYGSLVKLFTTGDKTLADSFASAAISATSLPGVGATVVNAAKNVDKWNLKALTSADVKPALKGLLNMGIEASKAIGATASGMAVEAAKDAVNNNLEQDLYKLAPDKENEYGL